MGIGVCGLGIVFRIANLRTGLCHCGFWEL
jgi:hypothetical protein